MAIKISPADVTHAPLLAEIHTSAFSTNRIMRAIYPTAAIWKAFQSAVEKRMIGDIADERTSVIVARISDERSVEEGEIVGFAVWCYCPGEEKADGKSKGKGAVHENKGEAETYKAPQWSLPAGTDWTVLTPWKEAAAKVAEAVIGNREHYELTWLAVSSTHTRLGIGTQLLNWGLALCTARGIPAYLDSTVEAAETFYAKAGFEEKGRIRMMVEGEMYEEVACLFEDGGGGG